VTHTCGWARAGPVMMVNNAAMAVMSDLYIRTR
jgi:hypothetical protein